jgi:tetratricopeptide (TPR) repeat protein
MDKGAVGTMPAVAAAPVEPPLPPLLPPLATMDALPVVAKVKKIVETAPTPREALAQQLQELPPGRAELPIQFKPLAGGLNALIVPAPLVAAYATLSRGDYAAAKLLYGNLIEDKPADADAHLGFATAAARLGDATLAARHYRIVLELDPRNAAATNGLMSVSTETRSANAEAEIRSLISKDPTAAPLHFSLGNICASERRWHDAQGAFFEAYRLDPRNADYAYNLAVSLDHLNQRKLALQYYQRALAATTSGQFDRGAVERRARELAP